MAGELVEGVGVGVGAGVGVGVAWPPLKLAGFCVVVWVLAGKDVEVLPPAALVLTAPATLLASEGTAAATAALIAAACDGATDAAAPAMVEANPALPASAAAAAAAAMTAETLADGTLEAMAVANAVARALALGRPAMARATEVAIAWALPGLAWMAAATASASCCGVALAMVTPCGKEMGSACAEASWGATNKARAAIMIFIVVGVDFESMFVIQSYAASSNDKEGLSADFRVIKPKSPLQLCRIWLPPGAVHGT